MSLLSGRKAYLPLEENTPYQVTITGYTIREATDPTPDNLGFATFKYEVVGTGQPITDNRTIPSGTDILARQLLQQLNVANGIDQEELFNSCIRENYVLTMYMQHREMGGNVYHNPTFQEPVAKITPAQSATKLPSEDDEAPFV